MTPAFQEFEPDENRRVSDPYDVIAHKVSRISGDIASLNASVMKLTESMTRIVLAEERISQVMVNLERIHIRLDEGAARFKKAEEAIHEIQIENVGHARSDAWVERAVVGIVVATGIFIANKVGLM